MWKKFPQTGGKCYQAVNTDLHVGMENFGNDGDHTGKVTLKKVSMKTAFWSSLQSFRGHLMPIRGFSALS